MMEPDITVLMPCYNAMPYIKEAIDSILNQTYSNFVLYVIYDDSNDGTFEYLCTINDERVYVKQNVYGKGIVNARNYGLDIAETKYVALMDADDIAVRERLKLEHDYMEKHQDVGAVGGITQTIDSKGNYRQINGVIGKTANEVKAELFWGNVCPNGTMMYRNSVIRNKNLRYRNEVMEDYLFWCDFSNVSPIVILPNLVLFYRVWEENRSAIIMGGHGSKERQNTLNEIRDFYFSSNGFVLSDYQKNVFFSTIREGNGSKLSLSEIITNFVVYGLLVKQARKNPREWSEEFILRCKWRRRIETKSIIRSIFRKK